MNEKKPDKVRVVFDCASKFCGSSLNDKVLQGPDMNNNLIGVLLRFREEQIAVISDIEAMFHQVQVTPEDRDAIRFLWWENSELANKPVIYRMNVHLFGGIWSPSCCNYALKKAATDFADDFDAETIKTIHRSFYVDDCLRSLPSVPVAIQLVYELRTLLEKIGFNLNKWLSNSREVLEKIPIKNRAEGVKSSDFNTEGIPTERALGVNWNYQSDELGYRISIKDKPVTRRGILSVMSSVYDPLGLVSPIILTAKLILQGLCRQQLSWDEPIPGQLKTNWEMWLDDLPKLQLFSVKRCHVPKDFGPVSRCALHHFSDASSTGHGAVSYLRVVNDKGIVHCSLVLAKAKLNPLKCLTIPRLELSAAVVAVKLDNMLRKELDLEIHESVFWTDSELVLHYIKNEKRRLHQGV